MPVSLDSTSNSGNFVNGASQALSWTHTTKGNGSVLLLAISSVNGQFTAGTLSVTTCTYGGTALTYLGRVGMNGSATTGETFLYWLRNPAAGANTIAVTVATTGGLISTRAGAAVFNTVAGLGSVTTASGATSPMSNSATAQTDGMVFGAFGWANNTAYAATGTVTAGTAAFNVGGNSESNAGLAGLYIAGTGASTSVSMSQSANNWWSGMTVPLLPSAPFFSMF